MIGFYDADLYRNPHLGIPNLEIMKLATYYRKRRENIKVILPNENVGCNFDKVFYYSDFVSEIPSFLKNPNLICGGKIFTDGKYIPFEEKEINQERAYPGIYSSYLKEKFNKNQLTTKEINFFLDSTYHRCFIGRDFLEPNGMNFKGNLFLYDDKFIYEDWLAKEDFFKNVAARKIVFVNPVLCENIDTLIFFNRIEKFSKQNTYLIDFKERKRKLELLLDEKGSFLKTYLHSPNNVEILFGETQEGIETVNSFVNNMQEALCMLYLFWTKDLPIHLKYVYRLGEEWNPYHFIFEQLSKWSIVSCQNKSNKTFSDYLGKNKNKKEYQQLLNRYPKTKNLFLQNYRDLKKRRSWRYDW